MTRPEFESVPWQSTMTTFAAWIMRGPRQATLLLAVSLVLGFVLPPFTWLSGAIAALVVLSTGLAGVLRTVPWAGLIAVLAAFLAADSAAMGGLVAVAAWAPVLVIAGALRVTRRLDLALLTAVAVGWCVVLGIAAFLPDPAAAWTEVLERLVASGEVAESSEISAARLDELIERVAPLLTGLLAAGVVTGAVTATLVARWWQAGLYNPGAFRAEFHGLRLGQSAALVVAGLLATAALVDSPIVFGLALVAAAVYVLQGLAVVHALVAARGMHRGWLVGMYALMVVMLLQMAVALIIVGIVDAWVDLRARVAGRNP